jgi:hypothetical protein
MHVRRRVPKCKCHAPVTQAVVGSSPSASPLKPASRKALRVFFYCSPAHVVPLGNELRGRNPRCPCKVHSSAYEIDSPGR